MTDITALKSILELADTIRREFGIYVAPTFHLHDGSTLVTLSICTGKDESGTHRFDRIEGEESDLGTDRQSVSEARDSLATWLAERRKEAE